MLSLHRPPRKFNVNVEGVSGGADDPVVGGIQPEVWSEEDDFQKSYSGTGVAAFQVLSTSLFAPALIAGLGNSDIPNALFPASLIDAPKCHTWLESMMRNLS